uniref:Putative two-component response regulator-like APRR5 isoform X1 n=2 Tax=Davidia involucrata TaxID=16924 RepID=A0A5B7AAQ9_DAVIN
MGEVVMSSEDAMDLQVIETETQAETEKKKDGGSAASVVRWERFLPRMVLRVLLVEADDSTRQIIAALLRKCSYKVVAVPDGLKAWEVLKGRPQNIDLILTEVELPSISGFALLSLIMEHEICKNIPVIMMSSNDSVSTVYKCMLRGAADFLVKPIRKNELRNLWQHVWRRQASTAGGHEPQDENDAQQKIEATAENNAASNHSSGYMACIQRNRECVEKGSDAQSSCTKPDLEAERACTENMQDISQPKWSKSPENDMNTQNHEECVEKLLSHTSEVGGSLAAACKDANTMTRREVVEPRTQRENANIISEACDNNQALGNSSREAIDLIGAFDNYPICSYRGSASNNGMNRFDSSPLLDLSLRRSHPSSSVDQVTDERHVLNHSDASAFSRYINKPLQPLHSTSASVCNQQKDYGTSSDKQLSNHTLEYNSDTLGPALSTQKNVLPLTTSQSGHAEIAFPCTQQRVFPIPVAVRGIRYESLCAAYGSAMPSIFCTESGLWPMQSPGSDGHQEPSSQVNPSNPETKNNQELNDLHDQNAKNSTNQFEQKQGQKLENLEDRGYFSSATDQSASSSFCNGAVSHINSINCVSNSNVNPVPTVRAAAESGNEEYILIHDGNSHRSIQREAALTKFRLKRKDRCYEKKIRYESRKKLAVQRPRVKGQFVRQVHTDPPPMETNNHCGNSIDG